MMNLQKSPEGSYVGLPQQAAAELLRRRQARRSLECFTTYTKADYQVNWHHRVLCEYLDRFVAGEIKRLMIFMPPRHGKSELVSRRLPAYIFGRKPDASIIACSYGADLAQRMNRDVQRIMDEPSYAMVFPGTRLYGKNVRTIADGSYLRNSDIFEIVNQAGVYRAAGIGGGIGGMGFHFGIVDDPIKNREEADSIRIRNSVWDWWRSTFYTRAEKDAAILLTTTRWHRDDIAGRILDSEEAQDWKVLSFPALCEEAGLPDDPRKVDEPLWMDKYNRAALDDIQRTIGPYQWASLYQQRPRPREGAMFKEHWLPLCEVVPHDVRRLRWWDRAATEGEGDYTAGVLMAYADGVWFIENVMRGQWSSGERDLVIKDTAIKDRALYGEVEIWSEQEPGSSGKDKALDFVRMLAGFNAHAKPSTGNKVTRAEALSAQAEWGNVRVLRAEWTSTFIDEMTDFPSGSHDDQVDAAASAFNQLALSGDEMMSGIVSGFGG
jgi:predicted phage terminase large subunit-like protein